MSDSQFQAILDFLKFLLNEIVLTHDFKQQVLAKLEELKGDVMALSVSEQALVDRFNVATSAISDKIDKLIAAGVSDSPEFVAKLQEIADGLDKLGQPGTPVPGPGPQPV